MGRFIYGIFQNDSAFGQLMTRIGMIIGANLMFVVFTLPVVTALPAAVALYHVMLRVLRSDGVLNPFKEFWIGFRSNWRQSLVYEIGLVMFGVLCYADLRFCMQAGGVFVYFRYAIVVLAIAAVIVTVYLLPVMAAFADTIPHLMRNAVFFAARKPWKIPVLVFFDVFPLYLTYTDPQTLPLYAFIWVTVGFGAVAMIGSSLLVRDFAKFLPAVEDETAKQEEESGEGEEKAKKSLDEMKKLGM